MPPDVRIRYTEGEASALTIIAREIQHHGLCDLPIDKIAALAGVSRTTVQNAIREAVRRGHVTVERRPVKGRKNLPTSSASCRPSGWRGSSAARA